MLVIEGKSFAEFKQEREEEWQNISIDVRRQKSLKAKPSRVQP